VRGAEELRVCMGSAGRDGRLTEPLGLCVARCRQSPISAVTRSKGSAAACWEAGARLLAPYEPALSRLADV
jgi:hypothetical protein